MSLVEHAEDDGMKLLNEITTYVLVVLQSVAFKPVS